MLLAYYVRPITRGPSLFAYLNSINDNTKRTLILDYEERYFAVK
jgi:hypothetical protein